MIKTIEQDIIQEGANLIVNASNGKGYMGGIMGRFIRFAGIAETIHYAEPKIEKEAKKVCKIQNISLGDIFLTNAYSLPYKQVLHAVTMIKPGQSSTLQTVEKCLKNIVEYCEVNRIQTVRIPYLGCGTGGLKIEDVNPLYEKYLQASPTLFLVIIKPKTRRY